MKRLFYIFLWGLMLTACEIPFEIKQEGESRIYVQGVADNGLVTISSLYATPIGEEQGRLSGLKTVFSVNGKEVELHGSPIPLEEGDELYVEVSADGLETASGTTIVPPRPQITDLSWERIQVDTIDATEIRMTLDHAPLEDEYYAIQILRRDDVFYAGGDVETFVSYPTPGYILTAAESGSFDLADFIQVNYNGRYLGGPDYQPISLLTKKQFDGALYKFYLNSFDASILEQIRNSMPGGDTGMIGGDIVSGEVGPGSGPGTIPGDIRIPIRVETQYSFTFYRLSPEFYFYAKALFQSNFDFLANMGLIPANFTWSNVHGGLGFVGAVTSTTLGPYQFEN